MMHWIKYDPNGILAITTKECKLLLQELDRPMGFGKEYVATEKQLSSLFKELDIPIFTNDKNEPIVLFMDTVHALAARVHEKAANAKGKSIKDMEDLPSGSIMSKLRKDAMIRNMRLAGLSSKVGVTYTTAELAAVGSIQKAVKAAKLRREIDARAAATKKAATAER